MQVTLSPSASARIATPSITFRAIAPAAFSGAPGPPVTSSPIGVPVVRPSNVPESTRAPVSASSSASPGGQPSMSAPAPPAPAQKDQRSAWPRGPPSLIAPRSRHRDVGRVLGLHADDVVAGIDMMNFAGDSGRQVRQQVEPGAADILDGDVAAQRAVILVPLHDVAEVADPARRQRLDRPGRDRID